MKKGERVIPPEFTVPYYVDLKLEGKYDLRISDDLYVNKSTLQRWKKAREEEIKAEFLHRGRTPYGPAYNKVADGERIWMAISKGGKSVPDIARELGISRSAAYRALDNHYGLMTKNKMVKVFNRLVNEKSTVEEVFKDPKQNIVEAFKEWL
jgi:hypothetical protein